MKKLITVIIIVFISISILFYKKTQGSFLRWLDMLCCTYNSIAENWRIYARATCYIPPGNFTLIGDSRAMFMGGENVQNARNDYDRQILADGEAVPVQNIAVGGFTTKDTLFMMHQCAKCELPYQFSGVTLISLGGNDVRNLYQYDEYYQGPLKDLWKKLYPNSYFEPYRKIRTKEQLLSFVWTMEVLTDQIAFTDGGVASVIALSNPQNKVIVNDLAPILWDFTDGWHWEYFYLVNWVIENKLNRKYEYNIVAPLQALFGDRIQFLETFPTFWDNIAHSGATYYLPDGIHISPLGNTKWGQLIAEKTVALDWYNAAPCGGGAGIPEITYDFPQSGSMILAAPMLVGLGSRRLQNLYIEETFSSGADMSIYVTEGHFLEHISTDETIDPNPPNDVTVTKTYNLILNGDAPDGTYSFDIIAKDTCGNEDTINLTYTRALLYWKMIKGWPWYFVAITYQIN